MLTSWFNASDAQEFGKKLAEIFATNYPIVDKKKESASGNKSGLRAKVLGKQEKVLGTLTLNVRQYGQAHSLNFYKKAKLGNAFKWSMLEKGYDAEFVDQLTKEVIMALK